MVSAGHAAFASARLVPGRRPDPVPGRRPAARRRSGCRSPSSRCSLALAAHRLPQRAGQRHAPPAPDGTARRRWRGRARRHVRDRLGRGQPGRLRPAPAAHGHRAGMIGTCRTACRTPPAPTCCSTPTTPSTGGSGATRPSPRRSGRAGPVLLSVGYAACHWCHVMAHESFEDEATAALMNDALRQRQGRPRGASRRRHRLHGGDAGADRAGRLADDGVPHARTASPSTPAPTSRRRRARACRPSARSSTPCRRPGATGATRSSPARPASPPSWPSSALVAAPGTVTAADLEAARTTLARDFDPTYGGLRPGAQVPAVDGARGAAARRQPRTRWRWPGAPARRWPAAGSTTSSSAASPATASTRSGSCRTSRRCSTTTPCCSGSTRTCGGVRATRSRARVVDETVDWLLAELRTPQGAFAASLDADSLDATGHLHEGAFYAWTPAQLVEVLGPEDGAWAARVFARDDGGDVRARGLDAAAPGCGGGRARRASPTSGPGWRGARAAGAARARRQGRRRLERLAGRLPGRGGRGPRPAGLAGRGPDGRATCSGTLHWRPTRAAAPDLARRATGHRRRHPRGLQRASPAAYVRLGLRDRRRGLGRPGADAARASWRSSSPTAGAAGSTPPPTRRRSTPARRR